MGCRHWPVLLAFRAHGTSATSISRRFTIFNPSHIGGSCKLYSVPLTFSVGGDGEEKKIQGVRDEVTEEVDYDDEEVEENPRKSSSANQKSLYEDLVGDAIQNLQIFFRSMYKKISEADIEDFEANYRGSDSEKKDVLKLFKECKGNMDRLFCCMLCSDAKLDSHRFKDIIDESISAGKIESTKAYKKWAKQVSKTEPPTVPLRQRKKSKERSEDLYAIIAQRQNERRTKIDTMFSNLVHKYGGGEAVPEPSEEESEAAQRNSTAGRNPNTSCASFRASIFCLYLC